MNLDEFIYDEKVDYTKNLINEEFIVKAETSMGISIGNQLKRYLLDYGYLGYGSVEFYGINSVQNLNSDMIQQTQYLHTYFPKTCNFIALGSYGDGEYVLIDSRDFIYLYSTEQNILEETNMLLNDYIFNIFQTERDS